MANLETESGFGFISIGKIKERRPKWLIKNILLKGAFVFISGSAKSGKSTLARHLAICLTKRQLFLSHFPAKKNRVLYYCLEDNHGELRQATKYMLKGNRFPERFYLSKGKTLSIPNDINKIKADIRNSKADVIIIDTFRRSHDKVEDSSSDMAPVLKSIRGLIQEFGITVILIHHTGHDIKNPKNPGSWLRGTSDCNAVWETLICIRKHREKTDMTVFHKYRTDLEMAYKVVLGDFPDSNTGGPPIVDLVYIDSDAQVHSNEETNIINALNTADVSATELEIMFKGKYSRPRIDAALGRLHVKGKVICNGKARNTRWSLLQAIRP